MRLGRLGWSEEKRRKIYTTDKAAMDNQFALGLVASSVLLIAHCTYNPRRVTSLFPSLPYIPRQLSEASPICVTKPGDAESIYPYWQRKTKPQDHPAITYHSRDSFDPKPIILPRCGFCSPNEWQMFHDVNYQVFEGDGDGLEKEEFHRAICNSSLKRVVTRQVHDS